MYKSIDYLKLDKTISSCTIDINVIISGIDGRLVDRLQYNPQNLICYTCCHYRAIISNTM